jgi:two-component SAPR family response regulator
MPRRFCICLFGLLAAVTLRFSAQAQAQPYNAGILFSDPTSAQFGKYLDLTPDGAASVPARFSISFDLAIWDTEKFGEVFLISFDEAPSLLMTYDNQSSAETGYFCVSSGYKKSDLILPLSKAELHQGKWHRICLVCDLKEGMVYGTADGGMVRSGPMTMGTVMPTGCRLRFGPSEDPMMAIRNIELADDPEGGGKRLLHAWPCFEDRGSTVHDVIAGNNGTQAGLAWLAPFHSRWQSTDTIRVQFRQPMLPANPLKMLPTVVIDERTQRIVIFDSSRIDYLKPGSRIKKTRFVPEDWVSYVVFDSREDRTLQFQIGGGKARTLDKLTGRWSPMRPYENPDSLRYYGGVPFVNPLNGDFLLFGGYGWYTASHALQRFNFKSDCWEVLHCSGDSIQPRTGSAICIGNDSTFAYLFGGTGNSSGRQQDGFHSIVDLWRLDLRNYSWERIWKGDSISSAKEEFFMSTCEDPDLLYVLAHEYKAPTPRNILYEFSLKTRSLVACADTLVGFGSGRIWFDRRTRQLYHMPSRETDPERAEFVVFRRDLPSIDLRVIDEYQAALHGPSLGQFGLFVLGVGLIGGILILLILKRKRTPLASKRENVQLENVHSPPRSGVYVFGKFDLLDSAGTPLSAKLSPKQLELFLYLLLKSGPQNPLGASTAKLTDQLWPDAPSHEAKNARGVAINKLRETLGLLPGVRIHNSNRHWRIVLEEGIFCDMWQCSFLRVKNGDGSRQPSPEELAVTLECLERGPLLADLSYEWLDPIQTSALEAVTQFCQGLAQDHHLSEEIRFRALRVLLAWDPVNETALSLIIQLLLKRGDNSLAKRVYDSFCAEYSKMFSKNYGKSMDEVGNMRSS